MEEIDNEIQMEIILEDFMDNIDDNLNDSELDLINVIEDDVYEIAESVLTDLGEDNISGEYKEVTKMFMSGLLEVSEDIDENVAVDIAKGLSQILINAVIDNR